MPPALLTSPAASLISVHTWVTSFSEIIQQAVVVVLVVLVLEVVVEEVLLALRYCRQY